MSRRNIQIKFLLSIKKLVEAYTFWNETSWSLATGLKNDESFYHRLGHKHWTCIAILFSINRKIIIEFAGQMDGIIQIRSTKKTRSIECYERSARRSMAIHHSDIYSIVQSTEYLSNNEFNLFHFDSWMSQAKLSAC